MLRTTSQTYTDFIAANCPELDIKAKKGKPIWVDRATDKAVAVRFTNKRGETVYYIKAEYGTV